MRGAVTGRVGQSRSAAAASAASLQRNGLFRETRMFIYFSGGCASAKPAACRRTSDIFHAPPHSCWPSILLASIFMAKSSEIEQYDMKSEVILHFPIMKNSEISVLIRELAPTIFGLRLIVSRAQNLRGFVLPAALIEPCRRIWNVLSVLFRPRIPRFLVLHCVQNHFRQRTDCHGQAMSGIIPGTDRRIHVRRKCLHQKVHGTGA